MTAVTYTAERELTVGHVQGTSYAIDLRLISLDPAKDVRKSESRSMSGATETVLITNLKTWQMTTAAVRGGELDVVREFLESVLGGESFQFDEFGRSGAPDDPVNVLLVGTYKEQRAVRQGDGGQDDYFRFSFKIRTF